MNRDDTEHKDKTTEMTRPEVALTFIAPKPLPLSVPCSLYPKTDFEL